MLNLIKSRVENRVCFKRDINFQKKLYTSQVVQSKRKVGFLVFYIGTAYSGSSYIKNSEIPTVESEIIKSLYECGRIRESNYGYLNKIGWSKSSRTDKGVHSLSSVFSCKLEGCWRRIEDCSGSCRYDITEQCQELPKEINSKLPSSIRIQSFFPVSNTWNARFQCIKREYEYMLPLSVLEQTQYRHNKTLFNYYLDCFKGRHNFHNFGTVRENGTESSTSKLNDRLHRNIFDITCEERLVNGKPYVFFHIVGDSFLTHQIRRMLGALLCLMQELITEEIFFASIYSPHKIPIPRAPSFGLILKSAKFNNLDQSLFEPSCSNEFAQNLLYPHIDHLWEKSKQDVLSLPSLDKKNPWVEFNYFTPIKDVRTIMPDYDEWYSKASEQNTLLQDKLKLFKIKN